MDSQARQRQEEEDRKLCELLMRQWQLEDEGADWAVIEETRRAQEEADRAMAQSLAEELNLEEEGAATMPAPSATVVSRPISLETDIKTTAPAQVSSLSPTPGGQPPPPAARGEGEPTTTRRTSSTSSAGSVIERVPAYEGPGGRVFASASSSMSPTDESKRQTLRKSVSGMFSIKTPRGPMDSMSMDESREFSVDGILREMQKCMTLNNLVQVEASIRVLEGMMEKYFDISEKETNAIVADLKDKEGFEVMAKFMTWLRDSNMSTFSGSAEDPDLPVRLQFFRIFTRTYLYLMLGAMSLVPNGREVPQALVQQHKLLPYIRSDLEDYYDTWKGVYIETDETDVAGDLQTILLYMPTACLFLLDACSNIEVCRPELRRTILDAVDRYADPSENHVSTVIYALAIIGKIYPENCIHKLLYPLFFFESLVGIFEKMEYVVEFGCFFVSSNEVGSLADGSKDVDGILIMDLTSLLYCFLVLVRSEDYKCEFLQLMKKLVPSMENVLNKGTQTEKDLMKDLLQKLCNHSCDRCDGWGFLMELLPKYGITFTAPKPKKSVILDRQVIDIGELHDDRGVFPCAYMNRCYNFLKAISVDYVNLLEMSLDAEFHRCFCTNCMQTRRDAPVYNRGKPPRKYALPEGWAKFALKMPPRAHAQKVFDNWHMAFHGTHPDNLEGILTVGDFLIPDDVTPGGRTLAPPKNHWNKSTAPKGHEIKQFFVSPSIKYCGVKAYAPQKEFKEPDSSRKMYGKIAFQVRVKPDSYDVIPETVGLRRRGITLDPHFKNEELEWATARRGVIILAGILIKVDEEAE